MNVDQAIDQACSAVGIIPPTRRAFGRWLKTDTLSGKSGKGDGRVIMDDDRVTAWNWQSGEKETVWLKDEMTPADRQKIARKIKKDNRERQQRADQVAGIAERLVADATLSQHPYLAAKGFPNEQALVLAADHIKAVAGAYLVSGERAIAIPARLGNQIRSVQFIWEDGTKKFLAGGQIEGTCHRIAKGGDTFQCEGFATGLTLRTALKGLRRSDTILCCFSASNVLAVSRAVKGRSFIVTDHDKPIEHYDGLGTGEYFAQQSGKPYTMPPLLGDDLNDMHKREGIFAVQRLLSNFMREARSG